jgi:hypothetical protein
MKMDDCHHDDDERMHTSDNAIDDTSDNKDDNDD